jgi:isoleucyl-tRNA synthetase
LGQLEFDRRIAEVRNSLELYTTPIRSLVCANIGFKYEEAEIPVNERPEIDQWIISELNTLIKSRWFYADYEPKKQLVQFLNLFRKT